LRDRERERERETETAIIFALPAGVNSIKQVGMERNPQDPA